VVEALDVSQPKERNENQKGDGDIIARIERCRDVDFFNRIVLAETPFRSCKPGESLSRLLIGRASSTLVNHENDSPLGRARGSVRTETLMLRRRHLKALQHCDHVRVQQILGAIGMNGTLHQLLLWSDCFCQSICGHDAITKSSNWSKSSCKISMMRHCPSTEGGLWVRREIDNKESALI